VAAVRFFTGHGERVVNVLVAVLLVASLAGPFVTTAAAVPSGMVTVPDANVSEDVPIGSNPAINATRLEGNVMASEHAESLRIIVTTPDRASDYLENGSVVGSSDRLTLVLKDDTNSQGRRVAIGSEAVRDALGYTPRRVYGTHEDGSEWSRPVNVEAGMLVFEVPHFSSNTITFSGSVRLTGSPATDGASWSYDVRDLDSVGNVTATVTGHTTTERDSESAVLANGETTSTSIAGTASPTNPEIVLEGVATTQSASKTGSTVYDGESDTLSLNGDDGASSASITFEGKSATQPGSKSGTGATDGSSTSVSIPGDAAPQNAQITFTGGTPNSETDTFSVAGGGSSSSAIAGSTIPSSATVDVSWSRETVTHDAGGTALSSSDTYSHTFDSPPSQPSSLTVFLDYFADDGDQAEITVSVDGSQVNSKTVDPLFEKERSTSFNLSGQNNVDSISVTIDNTGSDPFYVNTIDVTSETPNSVDVTVDGNTKTWSSQGSKTISLDGDSSVDASATVSGSGTATASISYQETQETLNPSLTVGGSTDTYSGTLGDGVTATVSVRDLSAGSNTLTFGTGSSSSDAPPVPGFDWSLSYDEVHYTDSPSVSGAMSASYSGQIAPGETVTVDGSDLSLYPGSNSLNFAMNGPAPVAWDATVTETYHSRSPGVDIGNDGTVEHSASTTLAPGATRTFDASSLSLSTSTIAATTADGTEVRVIANYTERTETQPTSLSVNGYSTSSTGTLADGESTSLSANSSWVQQGPNSVTASIDTSGLSSDAPVPAADIVYSHDFASTAPVR